MRTVNLYLASSSPRRSELLAQLGCVFTQLSPEVDENRLTEETPCNYVRRLAVAKAVRGWEMAQDAQGLVLGADTCIVIGDDILGKPADEVDALAMLSRLSGRNHEVYSAVALIGVIEYNRLQSVAWDLTVLPADDQQDMVRVSVSRVIFRQLNSQECRAYWDSGEPRGKAGAYAIQGRGAALVQHLEGSYSGVVGLPLFETAELLQRHGIEALTC